jgi:hypothetical protein
MGGASAVPGAIGLSQEFDGTSSFIQVPGTASSILNFPAQGIYSVSAWVYTDVLDSSNHIIVSKGDFQYNLEIEIGNTWGFSEFQVSPGGWDVTESPASTTTWTHLVGIRNGAKQYLYVNGICVDSTIQINPGSSRFSGSDLIIGRESNSPARFFDGKIDEVRISRGMLSAGFIKLCYMNQKSEDALVVAK